MIATKLIGQPLKRKEDERLIQGQGRYTDDIAPRDAVHAVFLRSIHAHARIVAIDVSAAAAAPGVLAALTAEDYAADGHGPIKHLPNPADAIDISRPAFEPREGHPVFEPLQPPLANGVVRYVGEAVAMIVATTAAAARDALELIDVTYEELPAVTQSRAAISPARRSSTRRRRAIWRSTSITATRPERKRRSTAPTSWSGTSS